MLEGLVLLIAFIQNISVDACAPDVVPCEELGTLPFERNARLTSKGKSWVEFAGIGEQGEVMLEGYTRSGDSVRVHLEFLNRKPLKLTIDSEYTAIRNLCS